MKKIFIKKVSSCQDCPLVAFLTIKSKQKFFCKKSTRQLKEPYNIPRWCELQSCTEKDEVFVRNYLLSSKITPEVEQKLLELSRILLWNIAFYTDTDTSDTLNK